MSKAKQQKKKQIKAELARGKKHFVIHQGLISWGIPTYLIYLGLNTIVQMMFYRMSFPQAVKTLIPLPIVIGLVIFGIAGVIVGHYRWKQLLKDAGKDRQAKTAKK